MNQQLLLTSVFFLLLLVEGQISFAAEADTAALPGMTPEKLEKEVQRRFDYVDRRLLSGRLAKTIEESDNIQARAILQRSREKMPQISEWIAEGKLQDAYSALQELSRAMRTALQLVRARERGVKKLKDEMDEARIINDAYFERVKKRGAMEAMGEVRALIERAQEVRMEAEKRQGQNDYQEAKNLFDQSTQLLKKAVSLFRSEKG